MRITRRHWMGLVCTFAFLGNLPKCGFATQNRNLKTLYRMNRFYIAGFQFYDGPRMLNQMHSGEHLMLTTEEENPHDRFAVKIERNGVMTGHVPRTDNFHISRLLRERADLQCEIKAVRPDKEPWWMVQVRVALLV